MDYFLNVLIFVFFAAIIIINLKNLIIFCNHLYIERLQVITDLFVIKNNTKMT